MLEHCKMLWIEKSSPVIVQADILALVMTDTLG